MTQLVRLMLIAVLLVVMSPKDVHAQAPMGGGFAARVAEAHGFYQQVTNDFGDWQGAYARVVLPWERDVLLIDALTAQGFTLRGTTGGLAHRHDWTSRVFHMLGVNVGDGSPLFPRYRTDGLLGLRWGASRNVQTTLGASFVQSVTDLSDVAAIGAITWYAPHGLVLETGARLNTSRPGNIRSHRLHGVAIYTPNTVRSFSLRAIAGTEGWQIAGPTTTLMRFSSREVALGWRERVTDSFAINLQFDGYRNPFYSRAGVTLGVARYW